MLFREERVLDEVKIALVGKYTKLEDAYISVLKALKHASLHCNRRLNVVVSFSNYLSLQISSFTMCLSNLVLHNGCVVTGINVWFQKISIPPPRREFFLAPPPPPPTFS